MRGQVDERPEVGTDPPRNTRMVKAGLVLSLALCCFHISPQGLAADPEQATIELISGEAVHRGPLVAIDAASIKFAEGESLPVDDALTIRFGPTGRATASSVPLVHLNGGGQMPVSDAVLVDDACRVTFSNARTARLSLNDVAAIQWSATSDPAWRAALARPSEEHDFVVAKATPAATSIHAFIESITADSVEFDWDKQTRTLPRAQVIGVIFARPLEAAQQAKLQIHTRDHALIPAKSLRRLDDRAAWQCTLPCGSELEVPADQLVSITIRSARVKSLSGMQPSEIRERPIVAFPRSWQPDRNVVGEPLRAGETTFERGIGVQSGSSLTYDIGGSAEQFVAILSVDSPAGVSGDCEFVVAADDREIARRRVKSGDEPVTLRLPLGRAKRLELRVEYGQNLDFGDHANWCDVHLVLSRSSPDES